MALISILGASVAITGLLWVVYRVLRQKREEKEENEDKDEDEDEKD